MRIEQPTVVPFAEIPGFPRAERNVVGHRGRLVVGDLGGKRVVAFQGRIHCYQGFSAREVSFPVRLAQRHGRRDARGHQRGRAVSRRSSPSATSCSSATT